MSQYIIHATPYSSPNSSKRIKSNWAVQNLRVFQESPTAGGGVFARFDLVNTLNPKDKKYTMNFSFADGTSMTANAINRIRRFFNEAYDRQRGSSYGFPQLSDTEKTQIVARINTAYNQFAGFSHSDEDADVIDCTSDNSAPDYLSVKMSAIDDLDYNYLEHHGILGMKWGIRRYQNADGSLTDAGRKRYGNAMTKAISSGNRVKYNKIRDKISNEEDRRSVSKESLDNAERLLKESKLSSFDNKRIKTGNAIYLERLNNRTSEEVEADNKRLDSIQEKAKKVTEEKITNNPEASGTDYLNYAEEHGDGTHKGYDEWKKEYNANNSMTNVERKVFDFVENNIKNLSDDKKYEILRDISREFDASYRDYPSVLVWDNKKNKIVAYPGYDEFSEDTKFKQYRDAWTSGNTVWLLTWGEEYDG